MELGSLSLQISHRRQNRQQGNKCWAARQPSGEKQQQQVRRTHFAVSAMPSSRDAALSPLQVVPRRPPALEGWITTDSDMVVGSQSVTEGKKRNHTIEFLSPSLSKYSFFSTDQNTQLGLNHCSTFLWLPFETDLRLSQRPS